MLEPGTNGTLGSYHVVHVTAQRVFVVVLTKYVIKQSPTSYV